MTTAREVGVDVLHKIRASDAYANLVLPRAITNAHLSARDAGHATDLTYGTERWRGFIDAVLTECVTGSLRRVDAGVLDLLRLASYELLIRDEPPHIINEWVTLAKRRFRRAAGFVNAALRAVSSRSLEQWRADLGARLRGNELRAVLSSHPVWIVEEYRRLVGETELDALLDANNQAPVPTLVALPGEGSMPADAVATEYSPYGFRSPGGSLTAIPGVVDGVVRAQDEGSQLAALALVAARPLESTERWLDLCAGPGGKTALLAAFAVPAGIVFEANEIQPHRAELVRGSLRPWGHRVPVSESDGRSLCAANKDAYDRILVDAPCTGLGALRRRPESRWRKSPADVLDLAPLQSELLSGAIDALTVGGVVAYVTCSPLTSETEDVVRAVLDKHPEAEAMDTSEVLSRIAPTLTDACRGTAVQLYPHRHHTDAMFIQLIRRTR